MAKERLKSPRARLFVALDLPDRVREDLEAWQARELTDPALRPGRPRLFAVEGESPATSELQAELSQRLEAERFYVPEKREFWTHVTVARVRSEKGSRARGGRGKSMPVESSPGALPADLTEPFK